MVASALAVVPVVWAEGGLRVATCSREPETGSVLIRRFAFVVQSCLGRFISIAHV